MAFLGNLFAGRGLRPLARDDEYTLRENDNYIARPQENDSANHPFFPNQKTITSASSSDYLGTISIINNGNYLQFNNGTAYDYLNAGETASALVTYTVRNAWGQWHHANILLTIEGENDAPSANVVDTTVREDSGAITIEADFSDPDRGDTHTITFDTSGIAGSATDNGDGTLTYSPNGQFEHLAVGDVATETFTYTVNDSNGGTDTADVRILVTGENDVPLPFVTTHTNAVFEVPDGNSDEGTKIHRSLHTNRFYDPDLSDTNYTVTIVPDPAVLFSSVSLFDGPAFLHNDALGAHWGYTLETRIRDSDIEFLGAGETITEQFDVSVTDPHGATTTHTYEVTLIGNNDLHQVNDISGAVNENGAPITLAASFSDIDVNDTHAAFANPAGAAGTVTDNGDGTFTYDPDGAFEQLSAGQTATDSFTYSVYDQHQNLVTATATVTITGENDAPQPYVSNTPLVVFEVPDGAANEGSLNHSIIRTNQFYDDLVDTSHTVEISADPSAQYISATLLSGPTYQSTESFGTTWAYQFEINVDDSAFEFLGSGETLTEQFHITLTDQYGATTTHTGEAVMIGANDLHQANDIVGAANEDGPAITLVADVSDLDVNDTHAIYANPAGAAGTVTDNGDGTFGYDPDGAFEHLAAGQTATDSFTYAVYDQHQNLATGTATVTITGENDAPILNALSAVHVPENTTSVRYGQSATDVDDGALLRYNIAGGQDASLFAINSATGALAFRNAPDYESPDDFDGNNVYMVDINVTDQHNAASATHSLKVRVTDVHEQQQTERLLLDFEDNSYPEGLKFGGGLLGAGETRYEGFVWMLEDESTNTVPNQHGFTNQDWDIDGDFEFQNHGASRVTRIEREDGSLFDLTSLELGIGYDSGDPDIFGATIQVSGENNGAVVGSTLFTRDFGNPDTRLMEFQQVNFLQIDTLVIEVLAGPDPSVSGSTTSYYAIDNLDFVVQV